MNGLENYRTLIQTGEVVNIQLAYQLFVVNRIVQKKDFLWDVFRWVEGIFREHSREFKWRPNIKCKCLDIHICKDANYNFAGVVVNTSQRIIDARKRYTTLVCMNMDIVFKGSMNEHEKERYQQVDYANNLYNKELELYHAKNIEKHTDLLIGKLIG